MNKYLEAVIAAGEYLRIRVRQIFSPPPKDEEGSILLLRPDMIGDLVCTTPFFKGIRSLYPRQHITLVVSPLAYNMMETCPYVDELLIYDKKAKSHFFMTNLHRSREFAEKHLRGRKWEMAVVLSHANPDTYPEAFLALSSGARRRVAYSEKVDDLKHQTYLGVYDLFFNELLYDDSMDHEVKSVAEILHYLQSGTVDKQFKKGELFRECPVGGGCPAIEPLELWITSEDEQVVADMFSAEGLTSEKLKIAVSLSTSNKTKDWPVEKYEKVALMLLERQDVELLLIGAGVRDEEIGSAFLKNYPQVHNFIGKTTVRQTVALLKKCSLYLGGDTGPMHLAASCGLGGVAIYKDAKELDGGADYSAASWFAPWQSEITVLRPEKCLPGCEHGCGRDSHCISQVSPEEVFAELERQLKDM